MRFLNPYSSLITHTNKLKLTVKLNRKNKFFIQHKIIQLRMNSGITALTFKNRTYPPDADGTLPIVLAEDEFHVKKGNSAENQHQRVGDKERT